MKIPVGPNGFPTLSATQFRTYGAGGFLLDEQEAAKGCPRLYKAKYVEKRTEHGQRSEAMWFGSFFHDVLFRMEEDGLSPDEALAAAFTPDMPQRFWTEARSDLEKYLERGASPMDRFGTLAVESELEALLYTDEDFGPIYYRGFIDWLGVDLDVPSILHVVDYKTNRQPPKQEDLRGDVQMRGYHWLVAQNAERWVQGRSRIVIHLDAVKFREVEIGYTDQEIDDWHSWAVAVARKILRDEEAPPVLNDGCAWCPVRYDCPAFEGLPAFGGDVLDLAETFQTPEGRLQWRDDANRMRLLLEKAVKGVDDEIKAQAAREGEVVIGDQRWAMEPDFRDVIDMQGLHRVLGSDVFYPIVSTTKKALERVTEGMDTHQVAAVRKCIERVPNGQSVKRRKVDG